MVKELPFDEVSRTLVLLPNKSVTLDKRKHTPGSRKEHSSLRERHEPLLETVRTTSSFERYAASLHSYGCFIFLKAEQGHKYFCLRDRLPAWEHSYGLLGCYPRSRKEGKYVFIIRSVLCVTLALRLLPASRLTLPQPTLTWIIPKMRRMAKATKVVLIFVFER